MDPILTWAKDRRETIRELEDLGGNLKTHAKNAKTASAVGNGTSIVAGVGAALCYFAAPFTFGGSLIPAAALTGVSIAGAATAIGSSITNYFIEKGYMKDVQQALDKDRASFNTLKEAVEKAMAVTTIEGVEIATGVGKKIPVGTKIVTQIASKLVVTEKSAAVLLKLGQTARIAGHAMTLIALPLDIVFFVKDAIDLAKGNVSAAADKVLELAKQLKEEYDEIMSEFE